MRAWNKAGCMVLALCFLLLATTGIASAQQGGISDSNEKVVSMNGFSSGRNYIVYLSWQPNGTDDNVFDIFIDDSVTSARLNAVKYDIALYKGGQLVASSQRVDQTTTRQLYDFEDLGQYTVRISNIENSGEFIDFSIQMTPEFPLHIFAVVAATFAGIVALHRFRPAT